MKPIIKLLKRAETFYIEIQNQNEHIESIKSADAFADLFLFWDKKTQLRSAIVRRIRLIDMFNRTIKDISACSLQIPHEGLMPLFESCGTINQ